MKTLNKIYRFIVTVIFCLLTNLTFAQIDMETSPPFRWSRLDPIGGNGNTSALGVGLFTSPNAPAAGLHVSPFGLGNPWWNGELFRTDGNETFTNAWRMFTGTTNVLQTERLALFTSTGWLLNAPGNVSSDINYRASSGNAFFWTNSGASPTSAKRMMINSNSLT